jgi:hypothetical protein
VKTWFNQPARAARRRTARLENIKDSGVLEIPQHAPELIKK